MTTPVAFVLRALGLGDLVAALPALQMLRAALPEHRIVLGTPAALGEFAILAGAADATLSLASADVVEPARSGAAKLRLLSELPDGIDVAVNLHGRGPQSNDFLAGLRPGRSIGYAHPEYPSAGPAWPSDLHEVDRWCRLITAFFPEIERAPSMSGCLRLPEIEVPTGLTLIHVGAGSPSREWPLTRFAEVGATLRSAGHDVAFTAGPGEVEVAGAAAHRSGGQVLSDLTLAQLAAVIGRARLLICGDTGVAHLASAQRTASVVLFGPVSPALWGPPDAAYHQVLWHGDGSGDPHADTPDSSLLQITVDEVLAACDRALQAGLEVAR